MSVADVVVPSLDVSITQLNSTQLCSARAVSSAIVRADALAIRNNAAALAFSLAHGIA